jgi:hypothetical protein
MFLSSPNFILHANAEGMIDPPLSASVNGPHAYLGDSPFEARVGKRESKRFSLSKDYIHDSGSARS